jgi:hypothetical protein
MQLVSGEMRKEVPIPTKSKFNDRIRHSSNSHLSRVSRVSRSVIPSHPLCPSDRTVRAVGNE